VAETKAKMVSVLSDNAATEMQLGDADMGYSVNILVAVDHRVFSRRVVALLNEEMNRALQAMRRHAEACRLPKKGK
jgi:hypothetical protein